MPGKRRGATNEEEKKKGKKIHTRGPWNAEHRFLSLPDVIVPDLVDIPDQGRKGRGETSGEGTLAVIRVTKKTTPKDRFALAFLLARVVDLLLPSVSLPRRLGSIVMHENKTLPGHFIKATLPPQGADHFFPATPASSSILGIVQTPKLEQQPR